MLKKGMNFAPAPTKIPVSQLISEVERGLLKISPSEAVTARKKVATVLSPAKPNLRPKQRWPWKSCDVPTT